MHDPMVVLFDIHVPIPTWRSKSMSHEPKWGVRAFRRTNPENLGEFVYAWWRPQSWSLFVAGRRIRMYQLATVWHVEPHGYDYGAVCGRLPRGWRRASFTIRHVRHLKVTNRPWQQFKRWAWQRCAECGGRSHRDMPVNVAGSWSDGPQRAFKSKPDMYHMACCTLRGWRRNCEMADRALADIGVTRDQLVARGWSWGDAYTATRRAERPTPTEDTPA